MKSHTLFISDLHLKEEASNVKMLFFRFMKEQAPKADSLYILGDLFEAWIGDDDKTTFNQQIISTLYSLVKNGTPIYFMCGNRDFLIGKKFARKTGVILIEDPIVISLYDKSVLLVHGDSLCTLDHKHQAYRRKITKRWVKKLTLSLPLSLRRRLAKKLREKSCNHNRYLSNETTDVNLKEVLRIMYQMNVELLIHGHTHRPAIHNFLINKKPAKRIVLGAWHENGSIFRYFCNGEFELSSF
ncbi:MAG: UDP-2,3-diacylglucosamine diphosphatase [Coxiella endosymbiont of Dermacentor nuttalli]